MANEEKRVSDLVDDFQRRGLYGFHRSEVDHTLSASPAAIEKALLRLAHKGRVKRLRRGFHVIVPVEYKSSGAPPYDWFLDNLMHSLELPYYIGLLSAAALHGAAHQQVQQLQIVVPRQERPIVVPGLSIRFFKKKHFEMTPLQSRKGYAGTLPVSTPEATALDLVRYARQIGGLDAVLTVLSELVEAMKPQELSAIAAKEPEVAQVQRLGWLLDHLEQSELGDAIYETLPNPTALSRTPLDSSAPRTGGTQQNRWRVFENAQPEADL